MKCTLPISSAVRQAVGDTKLPMDFVWFPLRGFCRNRLARPSASFQLRRKGAASALLRISQSARNRAPRVGFL
jgi:hypothetical protein